MASKLQSQNTCDREARAALLMRTTPTRLLKTGMESDVEVHCAETGRIWRAHKAIVCGRSGFIKKALTGEWKVSSKTQVLRRAYNCEDNPANPKKFRSPAPVS